jgi:hypothetical protein
MWTSISPAVRRAPKVDPAHEPAARLRAYDPADWLPLVDPDDYDPDDFRNRRDWQPYGEPRVAFEDWRRQQAWNLWTRARLDWCGVHGWPGGLDVVDLLRESAHVRRRRLGDR